MPGRTTREAVHAYIGTLQIAISCISDAVLSVSGGYYVAEEPHALTLSNGPMRLRRTDSGGDLQFGVSQNYRIVPWEDGFRVTTLKYTYKVDDVESGKEIIAYHWHPEDRVKYPHLHIKDGAQIGMKELLDAHVPTGRVLALEDVIQFLIESFHVVPQRDDWAERLEHHRQLFRTQLPVAKSKQAQVSYGITFGC